MIEMYFMFEGLESMIGKDKETDLLKAQFINMSLDFADELIELDLPLVYKFRSAPQEHMLDAVQTVEDPRQHAFSEFIQLIEEYSFA